MSVNKYTTADGLQTLANGSRVWIGTKANHAAARQAGTLPTDCLICITDDDDEYKTDQVIEDSQMVITSGGVYDALKYSTTETFTGQYWVDGKPIYRTVVNTGALPDSSQKVVGHNISNIDTIIKIYGFAYSTDTNKTTIPIPYANQQGGNTNITVYANKLSVTLLTTENISAGYPYSYITLEYTKTTN